MYSISSKYCIVTLRRPESILRHPFICGWVCMGKHKIVDPTKNTPDSIGGIFQIFKAIRINSFVHSGTIANFVEIALSTITFSDFLP